MYPLAGTVNWALPLDTDVMVTLDSLAVLMAETVSARAAPPPRIGPVILPVDMYYPTIQTVAAPAVPAFCTLALGHGPWKTSAKVVDV